MVSKISEEHSQRIFWVIQTIFGYIIGRSFHTYASVFIPPFQEDIATITIALITVYSLVLWSWINFSYTLILAPYQFKGSYEKLRFLVDLFIVLNYTYLLAYLDYINKEPCNNLKEFFICTLLIYAGYLASGLLRRREYGSKVSRPNLIAFTLILFGLLTTIYVSIYPHVVDKILLNRIFICIAFVLTLGYRLVRSVSGTRNYRIAIDVDGVLANQIDGILPIVKKELNIDLKYEGVTDWKLPLGTTSIDKIIVNEQRHRSYVVNMPVHNDARETVDALIKKYRISIATARPPESDNWTKEWLNKNKIQFDSFHNLREGMKHNEDFDLLIDDYPGNIAAFLEKHTGKAILFIQPWNQDVGTLQQYIDNGRLITVRGWSEIFDVVRNLQSK
jgi:5'(3')-deoxyribonucleotidase